MRSRVAANRQKKVPWTKVLESNQETGCWKAPHHHQNFLEQLTNQHQVAYQAGPVCRATVMVFTLRSCYLSFMRNLIACAKSNYTNRIREVLARRSDLVNPMINISPL